MDFPLISLPGALALPAGVPRSNKRSNHWMHHLVLSRGVFAPSLIYTGPPAIAAGIVLDLWGVGGPGTASRPVFDVKEYEERLGHCPRCSSEASIVASASSFRARNSLAGSTNSMSILASTWRRLGSPSDREHLVSANLGWSLATSSGGGFVSSNCQGQGETPETDCLNRNAELRRL